DEHQRRVLGVEPYEALEHRAPDRVELFARAGEGVYERRIPDAQPGQRRQEMDHDPDAALVEDLLDGRAQAHEGPLVVVGGQDPDALAQELGDGRVALALDGATAVDPRRRSQTGRQLGDQPALARAGVAHDDRELRRVVG